MKDLYNWLEVEFNPLKLCERVTKVSLCILVLVVTTELALLEFWVVLILVKREVLSYVLEFSAHFIVFFLYFKRKDISDVLNKHLEVN